MYFCLASPCFVPSSHLKPSYHLMLCPHITFPPLVLPFPLDRLPTIMPGDHPLPPDCNLRTSLLTSSDLSCTLGISFWSPPQGGNSRLVPSIQKKNLSHFILIISRAKATDMASPPVLYICGIATSTSSTPVHFRILVKRAEPTFQLQKNQEHYNLFLPMYCTISINWTQLWHHDTLDVFDKMAQFNKDAHDLWH